MCYNIDMINTTGLFISLYYRPKLRKVFNMIITMIIEIKMMVCGKPRLIFYLLCKFCQLCTTGIDTMRQNDRRCSRNVQ